MTNHQILYYGSITCLTMSEELEYILNYPDKRALRKILKNLNREKAKEDTIELNPDYETIKSKLDSIKNYESDDYKEIVTRLVKEYQADVLEYVLKGETKLLERDHNEIFCMLGNRFENEKDGKKYDKCFSIYVNHILDRFITKKEDKDILCFAANSLSSKAVLALLNNQRATLAYKHNDDIDSVCVRNLDPETIEEHFDSCIYEVSDGREKTILYDYNSIIPVFPSIFYDNRKKSKKEKEYMDKDASPRLEHEVLFFISQNKEFKHLLAHPLIASFLCIKWKKMRWIFYVNFIFYLMFCFTLLLYTTIFYIAKERQDATRLICIAILGVSTTMLGMRELYQMWVAGKVYFYNFENYMDIALISVISAMFFVNDPDEDIKQALCAVAVLLLSFKILFDLENIDSVSIYVAMFRRVSLNFFRCFPVYFVIIIAFSFCFYTFFDNLDDEDDNNCNQDGKSVKTIHLEDDPTIPLLYVFKTMIMLTGEFNSNDLEFETLASRIVFLVFVFMIPIVLLNLINGIAVSDAQTIREEAHIIRLANRVEYMTYCETVFKYYRKVLSLYHSLFGEKNSVFICLEYLHKCRLVVNRQGKVFRYNASAKATIDRDGDKKKPDGRRSFKYYNYIRKHNKETDILIDSDIVRETEMLLLSKRENRKQRDSEKMRKLEMETIRERLKNIENLLKQMKT